MTPSIPTDAARCGDRRRSGSFGSREGFVLPIAMVVLVLLSMIVATGLYSARHELWAAAAERHAAVALAAADAGASRVVATWAQAVPQLPLPGDSVVIDWQDLPNGAQFRAVVYRPPVGPDQLPASRVVLTSTGRARPPLRARRTVVALLEVGSGSLDCCEAGFKVSERLRVDGRDRNDPVPEIDGSDRLPPGWPASRCTEPLQDLPGVLTSDQRRIEVRQRGDIGGAPPVGEDPTIDPTDFTELGGVTYDALAAAADISFTRNQNFRRNEVGPVVAGGECDTGVSTNWGSPLDPSGPCGTHFPTIHVAGNLNLQEGQGQGLLLVDGDLTIDDDFTFFGLAIVLGRLRVRGNGRIYGSVMVRGGDRGRDRSEVSDEGKILYSSCAVERALPVVGGTSLASGRSWFEVF